MAKKNSTAAVTGALAKVLASNYTLYIKTQNYHWNVTGPSFAGVHLLLETQYTDLAESNDTIAERIRALGEKVSASAAAFSKLSSVKEETGFPNWKDMIKNLSNDTEKVITDMDTALKLADDVGDDPTVDLMTVRIEQLQKNKWMLDAHLE